MSKGKKYSSFLTEQKIFDDWRDYLKEENEMDRPGKNKKFIDPRYFMDEKMELNEGLRRELREVYSPQVADELAELIAEGAFGDAMTGPSDVKASDLSIGALLPDKLGGQGISGLLDQIGKSFLLLRDIVPNLVQALGGIEDAEVGFIIKSLRALSRFFGFGGTAAAKVLIKTSEWMEGLPPEQRKYLEDTMAGKPHKAEGPEPEAEEPGKLAAVAERRHIK